MTRQRTMVSLTAALSLAVLLSSECLAMDSDAEMNRFHIWLNNCLRVTASSLRCPEGKQTKVSFYLEKNGRVTEPELVEVSGDLSFDLACLEAVSCLPDFKSTQIDLVPLTRKATCTFNEKSYKTAEKRSQSLIVHKIPYTVLLKYPQAALEIDFNHPEIGYSVDHLYDEPADLHKFARWVQALKNISFQWARFYDEHETATKDELIKFSRTIYLPLVPDSR